jgi:hypothetical protein
MANEAFNACIASGAANLVDNAQIRASSQELLAPAENLQSEIVEEQWIGLNAEDSLVIDLGAALPFNTIAIMGLFAAGLRIRASVADPTAEAGDVYDSDDDGAIAVDQTYRQFLKLFGADLTARYVRLNFTGGPVAAGKIFIGAHTRFRYNFNYDWAFGYVDPSIVDRASSGAMHVFRKQGWRDLDVTFGWVSEEQRYGIVETIDRDCGRRISILFVVDPTSTNLARDFIWALATELPAPVAANPGLFAKQYRFEERR